MEKGVTLGMVPLGDKSDYGYHESEVLKCVAKCVTTLIAIAMVCATVSCVCNGFPRM